MSSCHTTLDAVADAVYVVQCTPERLCKQSTSQREEANRAVQFFGANKHMTAEGWRRRNILRNKYRWEINGACFISKGCCCCCLGEDNHVTHFGARRTIFWATGRRCAPTAHTHLLFWLITSPRFAPLELYRENKDDALVSRKHVVVVVNLSTGRNFVLLLPNTSCHSTRTNEYDSLTS